MSGARQRRPVRREAARETPVPENEGARREVGRETRVVLENEGDRAPSDGRHRVPATEEAPLAAAPSRCARTGAAGSGGAAAATTAVAKDERTTSLRAGTWVAAEGVRARREAAAGSAPAPATTG
jgi:hypothetical protein